MTHTATTGDAGLRFDVWISRRHPDVSRSRIQALIRSGHIRIAGRTATSPHARVADGMRAEVEFPPAEPDALEPEAIPLAVVHEDSDVIVVNKPAGMVVHPAAGHSSGTLVHALLAHCRDIAGVGGRLRPGIVHRLDRDTSGVIIAAKNDRAMQWLLAEFKARRVRKGYLAIVHGRPNPPSGRIESLIGRNPSDRKKMTVRRSGGRTAVTRYETIETLGSASLLRVSIETGRTHQIRVHMTHLGHPVVGDTQYGRRRNGRENPALPCPVRRQQLHAAVLSLRLPGAGKTSDFTAPMPADMLELVDRLRGMRGEVGAPRGKGRG